MRLLPSNVSLSQVRFVPALDWNGTVELYYRAWDRTEGIDGAVFATSANIAGGGSSAFSTSTETATLTVTPVNDAPVLISTVAPSLTPVRNNNLNPSGNLVSSLLHGNVQDVDNAALGIAIVAAATGNGGQWQYSLNGGTTWLTLGTPTAATARLIAGTTNSKIRSYRQHRLWERPL